MIMRAIQSRPTDLATLLSGWCTVSPAMNRDIEGVAIDSRLVHRGYLFFALSGTQRHGSQYIDDAVRLGAVAVLVESAQAAERVIDGVPVIDLPGLRHAAGAIIGRFFGDPSTSMSVVGVTGTNGKSTVTHLLAEALDKVAGHGPCGVIGTLGWGYPGRLRDAAATTPDAVTVQSCLASLRDERVHSVCMEVSSHALDQGRVDGVRFSVVVLTNLTRDHLDYHGDMAGYAAAKRRLFEMTDVGASVINLDDAFGAALLQHQPAGRRRFAYTLRDAVEVPTGVTLVRGAHLTMDREGIRFDVLVDGVVVPVQTRLLGGFNAQNLLAAFATLLALGVTPAASAEALHGATGVRGRMEAIDPARDLPLVVVDYAHTPDGLRQVLVSAREICAGQLWCVFGCGGNRDTGKRALMGAIAAELADQIVITSDNPRDEDPQAIIDAIVDGMPTPAQQQAYIEPERAVAVALAVGRAAPGDVVIVAGKGHENYQEVRGRRLPMSDHALVRAALKERGR